MFFNPIGTALLHSENPEIMNHPVRAGVAEGRARVVIHLDFHCATRSFL
ncbi:MAG: hypothetical protein OEW89_11760 [Gammaproteobacteria bacterium]|nr:hypothetical protein [Gammaproteobacteria bacterium]